MRERPLSPAQITLVSLATAGFLYLLIRAFFFAPDDEVAATHLVDAGVLPPTAVVAELPTAPASRAPLPPVQSLEGRIRQDRPVGAELGGLGVGVSGVNELVASLKGLFDFRKARPGDHYQLDLRTADHRILKFRYEQGPLDIYEVNRGADGLLKASKLVVPVRTELVEVGAELQVSLYQAMKRAGESSALVAQVVDVFAFDLDFYKDPRPGDSFKVLVEKVFSGDKLIKYGRLVAAEYNSQKRGRFRVFHFESEAQGPGGYFLADGQSTRKTFLKTPLKFARVSSKFDLKRKHPILKYTRAHLGTDYAAKTGTPVWSMADGVVRKAAFERGFGNLVIVDHRNGLLSFYAHLHRYAKGMKAGVKVAQKQLVGYVGMTGLATGPHLHFGVKKNGGWVNPELLKMTRDAPVPKKHAQAFARTVKELSSRLEKVKLRAAPSTEAPEDEADDEVGDDAAAARISE